MATERNCQGALLGGKTDTAGNFAQTTHSVSPVCRRSRGQPMLGDWGCREGPGVSAYAYRQRTLGLAQHQRIHTLPLVSHTTKIPCRRIHGLVRFEPEAIRPGSKAFPLSPKSLLTASAEPEDVDHLDCGSRSLYFAPRETIAPSPRTKEGAAWGSLKRNNTWWMSFYVSRAASAAIDRTSDKSWPEAILSKVRCRLSRGNILKTEDHLSQLMDRYLKEHESPRPLSALCKHGHECEDILRESEPFADYAEDHRRLQSEALWMASCRPRLIEAGHAEKAFNLACREWEWAKDNPVCRVSMEKETELTGPLAYRTRRKHGCSWLPPPGFGSGTFAVHTGMRRGEILALTWAGVDFTRRTVTVFKSKNGERRTIPSTNRPGTALRNMSRAVGCRN